MQVIKNRYTGNVGEIGLAFNPKSRRYFELTSHEREVFLQSNGDIKRLIESRVNKYGTIEPKFSTEQPIPQDERKQATRVMSRVRSAIEEDISKAILKTKVDGDAIPK